MSEHPITEPDLEPPPVKKQKITAEDSPPEGKAMKEAEQDSCVEDGGKSQTESVKESLQDKHEAASAEVRSEIAKVGTVESAKDENQEEKIYTMATSPKGESRSNQPEDKQAELEHKEKSTPEPEIGELEVEDGTHLQFSPAEERMLSTQMNQQIERVETFLKMDRLRRQKTSDQH